MFYFFLYVVTRPIKEEWYYILIDCAEKIFGKNSDRYEVNKEKFMNMIAELKEGSQTNE